MQSNNEERVKVFSPYTLYVGMTSLMMDKRATKMLPDLVNVCITQKDLRMQVGNVPWGTSTSLFRGYDSNT